MTKEAYFKNLKMSLLTSFSIIKGLLSAIFIDGELKRDFWAWVQGTVILLFVALMCILEGFFPFIFLKLPRR